MDEMFGQQYEDHHYIFVNRLAESIQDKIGAKIAKIEKLEGDILCEVSRESFESVIQKISSDPQFSTSCFKTIKLFRKDQELYALVVLLSTDSNINFIIKVGLSREGYRNEYSKLIETVAAYCPAASFFKKQKLLDIGAMDFSMFGQPAEGMDCFDVYANLDEDIIEKAIIDTSIAGIYQKDCLDNQDILKTLSTIGVYDYEAGIFPELCLCLGLERILQMRVSERANRIRMIVSELSRISSHLGSLANMFEVLGYDLLLAQILTEKERALKLLEIVTGARLLPNYIRIGGVRKDINEEKAGIIKKALPVFLKNIRGIESRTMEDILVFNRLRDTGVIDRNTATKFCMSGPNLRSAGIRKDQRKDRDYLLYDKISFTTPMGRYGDSLERASIRFKEIYQSLKIVFQALSHIPEEEVKKINNLSAIDFPDRAILSSVECPHGTFQIYMETGNGKVEALAIMGPSINSLIAAEPILQGTKLEDLPIILSSLNISSGEIIRDRWY